MSLKQFPLDEEYRKPTGITPEDVDRLRKWLRGQPHLPGDHITDLDLILVYHCCDRSTEVSKQLLDLHYTMRTIFTNLFKDRVVDAKIEDTFKINVITPLPTRSKEGYATLYTQFVDLNPQPFILSDNFRATLMVLDLWQYEEGTWPGLMIIYNMEGITLGHVSKLDIGLIQQFVAYLQDAILLKLKAIHLLNAPVFVDVILNMVKPFLKNSLLGLIHVHQTGSREIEKAYEIAALPKEAGGNYKCLKECKEEILGKLKANTDFFVAENKKRVSEARRPGRPKTISDFFGGIEGSFKKLDID